MAVQATLQAERRTITGKAVRHLRKQGILPANLTGRQMEPLALQVQSRDVERLLSAHGRTTVIRLSIAPNAVPRTIMIGHVQREPLTGAIKHLDLLQVEMTEKMRARITVHLTGEAPAVRTGTGIVLQLVNQLEAEALPDDLPEVIDVDISGLANADDAVYVRDLLLPTSVILHADPDEPVARIAHTRASIEPTPAPAEAAPALAVESKTAGA